MLPFPDFVYLIISFWLVKLFNVNVCREKIYLIASRHLFTSREVVKSHILYRDLTLMTSGCRTQPSGSCSSCWPTAVSPRGPAVRLRYILYRGLIFEKKSIRIRFCQIFIQIQLLKASVFGSGFL